MLESVTTFMIPGRVDFGVDTTTLKIPTAGTLILASQGIERNSGLVSRLTRQNAMDDAQVFYKPAGEPDADQINRLVGQIISAPQRILAIGGGSTIDMAKGMALLLGSGGAITDYEFGKRRIDRVIPVWAIPTTCGSGSEATPYAVINNTETGRKFTLSHPALVPERVLMDTQLLTHLEPLACYAGVLDALIHALEARLSRAGNPLIDPLAEWSLHTILANLPELPALDRVSTGVLSSFARAAYFSGVSIAHSRTGLIHTLSVALSRFVKAPHGVLNARIAPHVLNVNRGHYRGELATLLSGLLHTRHPQAATDDSAVDYLSNWLRQRTPISRIALEHQGLDQKALVTVLTDRVAQDTGLARVNPRPLDRNLLESLVIEILHREFANGG
jgi:alcohol dehydrogenase class IV